MIFEFPFEADLIRNIQVLLRQYPFLLTFFSYVTLLGEGAVTTLIISFFYFGRDKKNGQQLGMSMLAVNVFNAMLKCRIRRLRPYMSHDDISCLRPPVSRSEDIYDLARQGYSCPSGHAATSAALATDSWLKSNKKLLSIILSILSILISISRFALGVHYPSDVLLGTIIAVLICVLCAWLKDKVSFKSQLLILGLCGLPGLFFADIDEYFMTYGLLLGMSAAFLFEEKYIGFKAADDFLHTLLRVGGCGVVFLLVLEGMKYACGGLFLNAGTLMTNLLCLFRYGLAAFAAYGLYPYLFRFEKNNMP